jgi:hypothetical protein
VRWYLSYGLSYRDVEELLSERGIEVDHVTVYRWVQTFTSELFINAVRPARHVAEDQWFVDETYVKVAGSVDIRLPSNRSARPGYRRPRLEPPERGRDMDVLCPCAADRTIPLSVTSNRRSSRVAVIPPSAF